MNTILLIIIALLVLDYGFELLVEFLNIKHLSQEVPSEFKGVYSEEKYQQSQAYLKENTYFSLFKQTIDLFLMLAVLYFGYLNSLDLWVRGLGFNSIITGILFFFSIGFIMQMIHMPFSIYHTFYIEKKYGFNTTTVKTFILDLIKSTLLSVIIGSIMLFAILLFFEKLGAMAWLVAWSFLSIFQIILMIVAPILIMPLFNKFIPLESGDLRDAIESYAKQQSFKLKGIFSMDGSKRSTKSNAFFTGIGKWRRVVLLDTLISKHTVPELVSVLAHEIGHFKKKHILKLISFSIFTSGITFFIMSLFLNNSLLFNAFNIQNLSIYMSLVLFGFIFSPIEFFLGIIANMASRKYEFEADHYAVTTYPDPAAFVSALKKLSKDNLSNLTPHPLKVFLEYSHPPVLNRIKTIQSITQ